MIYASKGIKEKVNGWNKDNIYIISDFDRTITKADDTSSWEVIQESNVLSNEYTKKTNELYDKYRKIELNPHIDKLEKERNMGMWFDEVIQLLKEYEFKESMIDELTNESSPLHLRDGADTLLKRAKEQNIPFVIMSAGIRNIIISFLEQRGLISPNMIVIANDFTFDESKTLKGCSNSVIHSQNKDDIKLFEETIIKIGERKNIIMFGDALEDPEMISPDKRNSALKICFIQKVEDKDHYEKFYDIICTKDTKFTEILDFINVF